MPATTCSRWLLGGVLKPDGLHWSQPELLLYDDDPQVRLSCPGLVTLTGSRGFILDLWLTVERFLPGQRLLDTRAADGRGWSLALGARQTLEADLSCVALERVRLYDRALRTAELVQNHRAGARSRGD